MLFAKYLRKTYGIEFIKKIFENYETNETILTDIINTFKDENISIENVMMNYGICLKDLYDCFSGENITDSPRLYSLDDNVSIYNYGLLFVNDGDDYIISSTPSYAQENFNGESNIIDNLTQNGLIVLNKQSNTFTSDILKNNFYKPISIHKGWNLISNFTDENISLSTLGGEIVWVYRNGRYYAYSTDENIENVILNKGYNIDDDVLMPQEGAWVYSNDDYDISLGANKVIPYNELNVSKGWNLSFYSSNFINLNNISENKLIWTYQNDWKYYSKSIILNGIDKFQYIIPGKGYFIYNP